MRTVQNILSPATAGRTARCRYKCRYVSNFTTASRGFSATSRLSCIYAYTNDRSNAEITQSTVIFTAMRQNARRQPKNTAHDQNHGKSHSDREYVIILQR